MEETKQAIKDAMILFKNYDMLNNLSANELKSVESALKTIAGTAIMETGKKVNVFAELYNEIKSC